LLFAWESESFTFGVYEFAPEVELQESKMMDETIKTDCMIRFGGAEKLSGDGRWVGYESGFGLE
jgi:hypothetical protein